MFAKPPRLEELLALLLVPLHGRLVVLEPLELLLQLVQLLLALLVLLRALLQLLLMVSYLLFHLKRFNNVQLSKNVFRIFPCLLFRMFSDVFGCFRMFSVVFGLS